MTHKKGSGTDPMFAQFVNDVWARFHKGCQCHAGKDGFNKPLCTNPKNSSYGPGEKEGTWRCSILACPAAGKVYTLAKKCQAEDTSIKEGLDFLNQKPAPHLRVVAAN